MSETSEALNVRAVQALEIVDLFYLHFSSFVTSADCEQFTKDAINTLLNGVSVYHRNTNYYQLLWSGIKNDKTWVIEACPNTHININSPNGMPLAYCVTNNCQNAFAALIAKGVNVDQTVPNGKQTALMVAAAANSEYYVQALLAAGADKDLTNDNGLTPYQLATSEAVQALLA